MIQNINFICRRLMNYHKHTGKAKRATFNDYRLVVTSTIDKMGYEEALEHFKKIYPGIQFDKAIEVFDLPDDDNFNSSQLEMF